MKMRVTVAAILLVTGCAARAPLSETGPLGLAASMDIPDGAPLSIGGPTKIEVTLRNTGNRTLEGCFGAGLEVTFRDGTEIEGMVRITSHSGCEQRFLLRPGGWTRMQYSWEVPAIRAGSATVQGRVEIIDPNRCVSHRPYGSTCESFWIVAAAGSAVNLQ